jgi:undecaprenyl-phosphate 4-deoxy-4-formamido-L-arabinose transferase
LILRLQPVLASIAFQYELILVNDGSRDQSWNEVCKLVNQNEWVKGINLMRNYGQHNALLCGIRSARYQVIITLDDDLQNPPEEIPKLVQKLDEGYDVIYGYPVKEQHGLWRDIASQLTKLVLQNAMGAETARHASPFRAFRTEVRNAFADYRSPYVSIDVLLTWGTTSFAAIPVHHAPRLEGVSNYTFHKLVTLALTTVTGFSTLPLRLARLIGFAFTFFGLFVLFFVIGRYIIQGGVVPGFPFLASIIAIFSGAQLFAMGIIGEYMARMYSRTMEQPAYTIAQIAEHFPYESNNSNSRSS